MAINLTVCINQKTTDIIWTEKNISIQLLPKMPANIATQTIVLLFQKKQLQNIVMATDVQTTNADDIMLITLPTSNWESTPTYICRQLILTAQTNGLLSDKIVEKVPHHIQTQLEPTIAGLITIMARFGYYFQNIKSKKVAKPRHQWTKEIATEPFYINYEGAKATVYWQQRNQLLIKKGAIMRSDTPLNKDGSVGFSARFGEKLRSEHTNDFDNNITTTDIILKSVNEVGLFLYFAGTNSWLQIKNEAGKTLNELTIIR